VREPRGRQSCFSSVPSHVCFHPSVHKPLNRIKERCHRWHSRREIRILFKTPLKHLTSGFLFCLGPVIPKESVLLTTAYFWFCKCPWMQDKSLRFELTWNTCQYVCICYTLKWKLKYTSIYDLKANKYGLKIWWCLCAVSAKSTDKIQLRVWPLDLAHIKQWDVT